MYKFNTKIFHVMVYISTELMMNNKFFYNILEISVFKYK